MKHLDPYLKTLQTITIGKRATLNKTADHRIWAKEHDLTLSLLQRPSDSRDGDRIATELESASPRLPEYHTSDKIDVMSISQLTRMQPPRGWSVPLRAAAPESNGKAASAEN